MPKPDRKRTKINLDPTVAEVLAAPPGRRQKTPATNQRSVEVKVEVKVKSSASTLSSTFDGRGEGRLTGPGVFQELSVRG